MKIKAILGPLVSDSVIFVVVFSLIFLVVSEVTEHLPRSWDPTGIGMLMVILLFIAFLIGSFKIGAAYSDDLTLQDPGKLMGVFSRPVRSVKYGLLSLSLNVLLVYVLIVLSSYILH